MWHRKVSVFLIVLIVTPGAHADPLLPGSDARACENMLDPGPMAPCRGPRAAPAPAPPPAVAPRREGMPPVVDTPSTPPPTNDSPMAPRTFPIGGVSDEDIDKFLANHGKPPRAAVRALLNPTDENIRAMSAEQTRQIVNAIYVAERQAAINRESKTPTNLAPREIYTVLPHFLGMRLTLYVVPNCAACETAIGDFKRLLEEYPVVQARVVVITDRDDDVVALIQQWKLVAAAERLTIGQATQLGLVQVPTLEIYDQRGKSQQRIAGAFTSSGVRETVLALRLPKPTKERASP